MIYQQYMYSYPHKTAYRPLENIVFQDYHSHLQTGDNSLYIHIPFCESKCGYCNLFSVAGEPEKTVDAYLDAMERQSAQYGLHEFFFRDLTIGGGTPLLLSEAQLERIFAITDRTVGWQNETYPVVVETSPNQTTEGKLLLLKKHHVSRISMGVQSFREEELAELNRRHTPEQARKAIHLIKDAEFPCLNLDLIYGIPGQTTESLLDSAREAVSYHPEELFVYPLYTKEGTWLAKRYSVKQISQDHMLSMYRALREYLLGQGYVQHSMRRFVRQEHVGEDLSCGFGNTVSLGCGGRSYLGELHFCTPYAVKQEHCRSILRQYIQTVDYNRIRHGYLLDREEQKRRYVIKNLFFYSGISFSEYGETFASDVRDDFPVLIEWEKRGYGGLREGRYRLTEAGMERSDALGPCLISETVARRMETWQESVE